MTPDHSFPGYPRFYVPVPKDGAAAAPEAAHSATRHGWRALAFLSLRQTSLTSCNIEELSLAIAFAAGRRCNRHQHRQASAAACISAVTGKLALLNAEEGGGGYKKKSRDGCNKQPAN